MAGYRDQIILSIGKIAGVLPHRLLRNMTGQNLIAPFYHAISDTALPHISNLYPVKKLKAFQRDLDVLLKYYEPLDPFEYQRRLSQKTKQKPGFLLSFDDGLSSFYEIVAPILKKKGIPAICFINSRFVDNKALFYRYKASLLIDQLNKKTALKKLLKLSSDEILSIKYKDQNSLDEMAKTIGLDYDAYLRTKKPYLSQTQIKALATQGFFFGGHSADHPRYQYLSLEEQLAQTKESMHYLKDELDIHQGLFSFPFTDFGLSQEYFDTLSKSELVKMSYGCAGLKKDATKNHFQRIPLEMNTLNAEEILNSEMIYYLLKAPFGKNKLSRS